MSNSIDINIQGKENSIDFLNYYWSAFFSAGSMINQFDNGIEHRFQEVKDRFETLKFFILYNKNKSEDNYIVDLEEGLIYKDRPSVTFSENIVKSNIRLIYFRRNRKILSGQLQEIEHFVHYFIGIQYLNEKNENCQVLLEIDNSGTLVLGV
jgi:hypothetical protein